MGAPAPLTASDYEASSEYAPAWTQERGVIHIITDAQGNPILDSNNLPTGEIFNSGTDNHLGIINASAAYARGATGKGETLVVVDSGVNFQHPKFAGRGQQFILSSDAGYDPATIGWELTGHGTTVASVAVARREGAGGRMHGVAFDARLVAVAFDFEDRGVPQPYAPFDLAMHTTDADTRFATDQEEIHRRAREAQAAVVNYSFASTGAISLPIYNEQLFIDKMPMLRAALAQDGTPDADKILHVAGAGNEGTVPLDARTPTPDPATWDISSPIWSQALPVFFKELIPTWITVVAVRQSGEIAFFSNRCGLAKAFCIAAPGEGIVVATADGGYGVSGGTSLAGPMVAGALVLLRQYYPMLGNTELAARVLRTADKTDYSAAGGPNYSNQEIYGQGLLDLDAATRAFGATSMSAGPEFGAPRYASELSALTGTAAFGDALARGLRGRAVALFDTLDAPFPVSLDSFVAAPSAHYTLGERVAHLAAETQEIILPHKNQTIYLREEGGTAHPDSTSIAFRQDFKQGELFVGIRANPAWHFGLSGAGVVSAADFSQPNAASAPALALVQDGISFGGALRVAPNQNVRLAFYEGVSPEGASPEGAPDDTSARAYGLLGEYSLANPRAGVSLQAGWLHENARALGASGEGAFSGLSADTWLSGATAHLRLGAHWTGFAAAHAALSVPRLQNEGRVLHALSPFWSSSFSLGVAGNNLWHPSDRLTLKLAQPQRVESGTAQLRYASGRTRYRELILEETNLSLTPSARQLDIELAYARPLTLGSLRAAILVSQNPAHTSSRDAELNLLAQYQLKF